MRADSQNRAYRNATIRQMARNGYSEAFIARKLGLSRARVHQVISGKQPPIRNPYHVLVENRERRAIQAIIDQDFDTRGDR